MLVSSRMRSSAKGKTCFRNLLKVCKGKHPVSFYMTFHGPGMEFTIFGNRAKSSGVENSLMGSLSWGGDSRTLKHINLENGLSAYP